MIDKDEFNAAVNIMIPIKNPKGSQNMKDIQNEEKMAHIKQELEILREELRQVRDLAKLSATTFPTFKTPIYFTMADLPSAYLPNQPRTNSTRSSHTDRSDLSNRDPTIPTKHQILGEHVAAPYDPHVPPVYVVGAPTFTMPVMVNVPYEVDQYAEMEKDAWLKEDASINAQLHDLRKALKSLQVTRVTESLDYDDMCIHPDIDMPYFIRAQEGVYFDKIMSMMGQKLAELVKMGDFIENERPSHQYPNNPQFVAHTSYVPYQVYNTQPHYNPPRAPAYQNLPRPYVPVQAPIHQNRPTYALRPRPNLEARNDRVYTPITETLCPIGIQGYDIEDCYNLKNQIKSLINKNGCVRDIEVWVSAKELTWTKVQWHKKALIPDQLGDDHIVEGIGNLFVAMAGEEEEINLSKLTIRDAEHREILQNWTISPSLFQPKSW
ncbi:hypothetical protein H5410_061313 [Solanum commersonii]|uniref:Uncharacterized protein n=1 Tax=Solanum commersonii TaxID=4109 RepID=A0A9J5W7D5_SOLCO|nr:hypothetical protein H5410_061313 [Solanum commersonii]